MAFMHPFISANKETYLFPENQEGQEELRLNEIPDGDYDIDSLDDMNPESDEGEAVYDTIKHYLDQYKMFTVVTGYAGYLSAPGYCDMTDVTVAETQAEVAQALIDMYYDGDPEYMDSEEKEELVWLEEIAKNES